MLIGNIQHFFDFLQRQRRFAALLEDVFYGAGNGLRNTILRYQVELIVPETQAYIEVLFYGFDIAVQHSTEIGDLFLGKV